MIFVTVGTHYLPFNRLLSWVDGYVAQFVKKEEVVVQFGTSTKRVISGENKSYFQYSKFCQLLQKARIVITHAGPATIYQSIALANTIPIVVPRLKKFSEHVSNHQLYFAQTLASQKKIHLCLSKKDFLHTIQQDLSLFTSWDRTQALEKKLTKYLKSLA